MDAVVQECEGVCGVVVFCFANISRAVTFIFFTLAFTFGGKYFLFWPVVKFV